MTASRPSSLSSCQGAAAGGLGEKLKNLITTVKRYALTAKNDNHQVTDIDFCHLIVYTHLIQTW